MSIGRRILPPDLEFEPFDYHGRIIQIDETGDWNVYDGEIFLAKFSHCRDAMSFIDGAD